MIQKLLLFVHSFIFLKLNSFSSSGKSFIPSIKLLCLGLFFVNFSYAQKTWDGSSSSNWNTNNNWTPSGVPGTNDDVTIPTTGNAPVVSNNVTCRSITFTGNTATLTVNSGNTLTTGAITINSSNTSSRNISITGAGTISSSSVGVGITSSTPTALITTTLTSNIARFNISGNIAINSTWGSNVNNSIFNLESGILDISGQIRGVNQNAANNATFTMASGLQSATLLLANANPLIQTGPGTSTLNLNGTGSTVNYDGTAQAIFPTVYNNLIISGSGNKTVSGNITVNKDFTLTGGTFSLNNATNYVFTILGNYNQTGGVLDFNAGTSGTSNMYLAGNLTNSAGGSSIFTVGNVKNGIITFNGTGVQTLNMPTAGAAIWTKYIVNGGSTLKLLSNLTLNTADPATQADWTGDLIVNSTGTIDFGTFQVSTSGGVTGAAIVTVNSAANVITANTNGLNGSVAATNINSTFSPAANYTFNGSSAQVTGTSLPATVNNLSVINTSGLTLSNATTVTNDFSLASGSIANLNTFTHTTNRFIVNGNGQNSGSWGSTVAPATYKSAAYFGTSAIGILNATTAACTAGYWTGAISTDWNTAANWCGNTVPTNATNVIIPAGTPNMPTIAAGTTATVNNLTIDASATLSLANNATSLLNISGNFVSNGTFTAGAASTISFVGGTQSLAGVTYSNLTLSAGNKTFAGNIIITNNLIVNSGAVIILNGITTHTAGTLTLNGSGPLKSTWGASGSGAANTNDTYFSGTGRITINGTPPYPAIDKNYASYSKGVYGKVANSYLEGTSPVPVFSAPVGTVFVNVDFASYGLPSGLPAPFTLGTCDAFNSRTVVTTFLGNTNASIPATNAVFGDPCYNTGKRLSIQATYTEPICSGTSPGLITGSDPTGGNGIYAFSWSVSTTSATSGYATIAGIITRDYTPGTISATTWYKRTVTSGMYTSETIVVVPVNVTPTPPTTITTPVSICAGSSTTLTVSGGNKGGNGGYAQWFSGSCGGTYLGDGDSITVTPTANTTYYARYKNGCTTTTCISTTVSATVSVTGATAADVCVKSTSQTTPLTYTSSTGTPNRYSIVWSTTPANSFANVTDVAIANPITIPANAAVGTYTGTLTVKNAGNCSSFATTFTLTINTPPVAPTVSTTQPTCSVNTGTITITSPSPAAGISYSIDGSTYTNTTGVFAGLAVGPYNVTTKNNSGCFSPATPVTLVAATVKTWTGTTDTKWNLASNWSPNGIPTASDCVVIPNVTNQPILSGTPVNGFAQGLTVNNNASLTVFSANTLNVADAITVGTTGSIVFENNSSLLQSNNSPTVNTGNITYKRISPQIRLADFTYWSTPVKPQTLFDVSPGTLFDKYFGFDGDGWVGTNSSTVMTVGKGYIIRGPQSYSRTVKADYTASFIGVPNNGNLTGETLVANKFYLIGNPYPSALDAKKFLDGNIFLNGTLYFWTHNTGVVFSPTYQYNSDDYAAYNITGGTATYPAPSGSIPGNSNNNKPSGMIAAGQSFFASTGIAGGTVAFDNSMRSGATDNSQFFKPGKTETTNRIWLNITNDEGAFKQLLVGYVEGATNEFDNKYDGLSFDGNPYVDFYSVNNENKYVIQGRALPFTESDVVPLGYRTTIEGTFTIAIDQVDGGLSDQNIYIEDKATAKIHDLRTSNYTFTTAIGTFTDRFVLRYANTTLGVGDVDKLENNVLVSVKEKVIKVTSSKENLKQVTIFDVSGKRVYDKNKVGATELQLQNLPLSDQVLLVKVVLENGHTTTKKVIFK